MLCDSKDANEQGKEMIISIADLEVRRSRAEKEQSEEQPDSNRGKKIDFVELASRQKHSFQKHEDDDELKPFA